MPGIREAGTRVEEPTPRAGVKFLVDAHLPPSLCGLLQAAGHDVVGLDTDLFEGCEFGEPMGDVPEIRKDLRDITVQDLEGFEGVVHLAAL